MRRIVLALLILATLLLPASTTAQADSRTFPETGQTVSGRVLQYLTEHGGLAQQGFPISPLLQEVSPLDGKTYTVQYFERAVFEQHPDNAPPFDVLLSQLGTFRYKAKYVSGAGNQAASPTNPRLFPETGKTIGGTFRAYWEAHGGLAQQGFPITDEFTEISDLNNQPYRVQYFERAVFEAHAENQPPFDVLLSQLGTFQYKARYSSGPPATAQPTTVAAATATSAPVGAYAASARVSDPNPSRREIVTVTGTLLRGGVPVVGAIMNTAWNYKSTTTPCNGSITNAQGIATCALNIGGASAGYPVRIDVAFLDSSGNVLARTSTSFTPK